MANFLKTSLNDIITRTDSTVDTTSTASTSNIKTNVTNIKQPTFKTSNLKDIINRQSNNKSTFETETESDSEQESQELKNTENTNNYKGKKFPKNLNWKQELEDRLEANRLVSPDLKRPIQEIEDEFWIDCFISLWPEELLENLQLLGGYFKKDLLNWGFSADSNPMVAFLNQNFVQKKLLLTKKLNANSYMALHNAVVKKYLSLVEFRKANDYNILYCLDLYNKLPADIYKYLELQKVILNPKKTTYSAEIQTLNKRIFIKLKSTDTNLVTVAKAQLRVAKDKIAKLNIRTAELNNFDLIKELLSQANLEDASAANQEEPEEASSAEISEITNNVKTRDDAAALTSFLTGKAKTSKDLKKITSFTLKYLEDTKVSAEEVSKIASKIGTKSISSEAIEAILYNLLSKI